MLKIYLLLAGFWALLGCTAEAVQVQFTWDYDFNVDRACSTTTLTDCVKGFRIREGGGVVVDVAAPALTATVELTRPYGARSFFATAVTDTGVESLISNTVQIIIRPDAPRNLR